MLIHSMTTTSECKVQECLAKHSRKARKAFVLSTRIANDPAHHVRYDVFVFEKDMAHN
ncbi:MAG: hypothetical protein KAU48_09540 [Candidatus Thorarchaeota archaeon]|nr:hypothetical protein [Candidatus Thorarchaeota archaeon]